MTVLPIVESLTLPYFLGHTDRILGSWGCSSVNHPGRHTGGGFNGGGVSWQIVGISKHLIGKADVGQLGRLPNPDFNCGEFATITGQAGLRTAIVADLEGAP